MWKKVNESGLVVVTNVVEQISANLVKTGICWKVVGCLAGSSEDARTWWGKPTRARRGWRREQNRGYTTRTIQLGSHPGLYLPCILVATVAGPWIVLDCVFLPLLHITNPTQNFHLATYSRTSPVDFEIATLKTKGLETSHMCLGTNVEKAMTPLTFSNRFRGWGLGWRRQGA